MNKKKLANVIYLVTIVYGVLVMAKVLYDRSQLPKDVCPTDLNSPWIYSAIVLLIGGAVVSWILERIDKKEHKA